MMRDEQHGATKKCPVAVVAVPLPGQGHLNQMLQLSCLISAYDIPVYFAGSAIHNRQAQHRISGGLNVSRIQFVDFPIPSFPSPPPNPNSKSKFPSQLFPMMEATLLNLRHPLAAYVQELAQKFERVVVVHDYLMSYVVQDLSEMENIESYDFICVSAFSILSYLCGLLGLPFPVPHPTELPQFYDDNDQSEMEFTSDELKNFSPSDLSSGTIFNTSRTMEAPYVEFLEREGELNKKKKPVWAIGPMLLPTASASTAISNHECFEWVDKQEPESVIFICFGSTVSLSEEEIKELAHGLERSKVKFLWVLRDADRGNVFEGEGEGEVRRAQLPEGFGSPESDQGIVVKEWVPQPQILAHPSIGGFMSHCGWNSCIETITAGVPVAAWPMHSDQPTNAALVADVFKTGVIVREWKDRMELVEASRVEHAVRRLMASKDGDEMRKTAKELAAAVRRDTEPGGASRLDLDSFIAHITS